VITTSQGQSGTSGQFDVNNLMNQCNPNC
jgi:hypothetical protein